MEKILIPLVKFWKDNLNVSETSLYDYIKDKKYGFNKFIKKKKVKNRFQYFVDSIKYNKWKEKNESFALRFCKDFKCVNKEPKKQNNYKQKVLKQPNFLNCLLKAVHLQKNSIEFISEQMNEFFKDLNITTNVLEEITKRIKNGKIEFREN